MTCVYSIVLLIVDFEDVNKSVADMQGTAGMSGRLCTVLKQSMA